MENTAKNTVTLQFQLTWGFLSLRNFIPTKTKINAQEVAQLFIENVFKLHGLPQVIVSDRDPKFISSFL